MCVPGIAGVIVHGVEVLQLFPGEVRDVQWLSSRHNRVSVVWEQLGVLIVRKGKNDLSLQPIINMGKQHFVFMLHLSVTNLQKLQVCCHSYFI